MRMKILGMSMAALAMTVQALAMPTRAELSKAQPLVNELMSTALDEYKSASDKTAAAVKVGDESCAFASEAETEAVKFLLLKGAVNYYVRGEAYDKAADCIDTMQAGISNLTPDVVVEIVGKATSKTSESKAPRLIAYYRAAKLQIRAKKELPVLERKLKRVKSEQLQRQYAEALAISGNWKAAYDAFAKVLDKNLAQIAKAESKGAAANEQAAELWWNYAPEFDGAGDFFKVHAVEFYQKAIEKGEISGLKKNIVERRIAQFSKEAATPANGGATPAASGKAPSNALYCIVDLSAGSTASKYPIKWLAVPPAGGFNTDEYKTTKLVLRRIEPGKFKMGGKYEVTLTKPYYIGIFETTQKQYKQVTGSNRSRFNDDGRRPVERISWNTIRGDSTTYNWPNSANVDPSSFMGKMQTCTGLNFDLPTEAQWEYACRAGSDGEFGGTGRIDDMGWYKDNSGGRPHPAGQKQANAWGIYDMHGNVGEWCLDWKGDLLGGETDPVGSFSGSKRIWRGGCWCECDPRNCGSSARGYSATPSFADSTHFGFRLCMNPEASVGVLAQGSGAPAASSPVLAPPTVHESQSATPPTAADKPAAAPARAANGREISVQLKTGVTMDFVPCPSGTFEMGVPGDDNPRSPKFHHTVQITRPFWIGKYQVTWRQWQVFDKAQFNDVINSLGGPDAAKDKVTYHMAKQFCESMNKKFKRYIPKSGYVYRLPTEAEWTYALYANCKDESDPHAKFLSGNKDAFNEIAVTEDDKLKTVRKFGLPANRIPKYVWPPMKVGTKKPNVWGVYDMLGNGSELVLDTCQIDNFKKHWGRNEHTDLMGAFLYKEKEVDPLYYAPSNASCPCSCYIRGLHHKILAQIDRNVEQYACFRVVIGPDLVAEKMAKNGKR